MNNTEKEQRGASKKRDIVAEIAQIKTRRRYHASTVDVDIRLRELKELSESKQVGSDEIYKYLPIATVACIESGFRVIIKELVDSGPPYLNNAHKLIPDVKFDYRFISAFHGSKITIGELVSHLVPISSIDHINSHLSVLLDIKYLRELPFAVDYGGASVLDDCERVFNSVTRMFELRHIFSHEVPSKFPVPIDDIKKAVPDVALFMTAASSLHFNILYPDPGMSQADMNMKAGEDWQIEEDELKTVLKKISQHLSKSRFRELINTQKKWEVFMKAESKFQANQCKGGSIWPTLYCSHATTLTKRRTGELREYLKELEEFGDKY